jgi:hypothetical protein
MTKTAVKKDQTQYPLLLKLSAVKDKIAARDLDFARSLVTNFNKYGRLSGKQLHFVEQIISRAENPAVAQPTIQMSVAAIQEMFIRAAQNLKRIKVTLKDSTGQKVVFKMAGPMSKYAGQIMISDGGAFGAALFFGRIQEDGVFVPTSKATPTVVSLIKEFAADPEDTAGKYGRLTGSCCFCTKPLDDQRSLTVGYGPVCAKRFGLKWGK